jgi:hypothetical protein
LLSKEASQSVWYGYSVFKVLPQTAFELSRFVVRNFQEAFLRSMFVSIAVETGSVNERIYERIYLIFGVIWG